MRKVRDVDLLSKKYTTKQSELKDVLKRHINFLKAEHPELVSDNKGLFMFSKDKKVLSTSDLIQNLKAIVLLLPVSDTVPDVPSSDDESSSAEDHENSDEDNEVTDEEDTADELPTDFSPNMIDRCVAVGFVDCWYPGYVTRIINTDTAEVNFMHPSNTSGMHMCSTFQWPKVKDCMNVSIKAVISMDVDMVPQDSSLQLWKLVNLRKINSLFK